MKQLLTLAIVCLTLWGCAGDEVSPRAEVIRFELGAEVSGEVDTRAIVAGTNLPVGDRIGLFGYSYGGANAWPTAPDLYHNTPATVGAPGSNRRNALTVDTKEYTHQLHAFYAYYPYRDGVTAGNPIIEGDLFADGGQVDWLWSDPVTALAPTANPVRLIFRHQLTLMPILVGKTREVGVELKLEQMAIETAGTQRFAFNIATGSMQHQAGGETRYDMVPANDYLIPDLEDGESLATATAENLLLLPATRIEAIELRVNGEVYRTPDDWTGFDTALAGQYRMLSIVMGISEITITIGRQPWEEGDDTNLIDNQLVVWLGEQGWQHNPGDDTDFGANPAVVIGIGKQGWKEGSNPIQTK